MGEYGVFDLELWEEQDGASAEYWGRVIRRPDGSTLCVLGEPEDCNFRRDGKTIVPELNMLLHALTDERAAHAALHQEHAELRRLAQAVVDAEKYAGDPCAECEYLAEATLPMKHDTCARVAALDAHLTASRASEEGR